MNRIIILFSLSMSIKKWQAMGIFEKEILIFSQYLCRGLAEEVLLFTYDHGDIELIDEAKEQGLIHERVHVIKAPDFANKKFGAIIYSLLGPIIQRWHFRRADAAYSHQSSGAWTGLIAKLFFGRHFVYRYGHSLWRRHLDRKQYHRLLFSWPLDRLLTKTADFTLMCTQRDYLYAGQRSNSAVCPNFIDTSELPRCPATGWQQREKRAVFVGRLMSFKNLHNLIEACARQQLPLDIYGAGPLEQELRALAVELGGDCNFMGVVNNQTIRERLPEYAYFFLVSTYEGMPKSLLEGMASGCLCIVSPHYGCTEIVRDKHNGLVSHNYSVAAIADVIKTARSINSAGLARRGQLDVEARYSLNRVIEIHRAAYHYERPLSKELMPK